jgi:hypothetical protein
VTAAAETKRRRTPRISLGRSLSPEARALLAVVTAVVVAHLPFLIGFFNPDPLGSVSGVGVGATPGLLRGYDTADPNSGFISQALGHRASLELLGGHLPWWNPYEGTGAPLAGETQSAALFPPTLLTRLADGQVYEHMLLAIVAGLSTFLLLRRISVTRWMSAAAAIAFALNGTFAWYYAPNINPVAFLPLLLLGIELAYAATIAGRRGGWWVIAVAGALSVYAGFPEVAYIDGLLSVFWFAWRCGCVSSNRLMTVLARKAAAGVIAGVLLSAPLLIASFGYFGHADLASHGGGSNGTFHLPLQVLPELVLPYVWGPIFSASTPEYAWDGGYLSSSLVLFALIGLFSKGRRGLRLTLLIWIVLAVARIYGQPAFLGDVLGIVPGMSRVAFSRYAFASLELAVVILAALGLDVVARGLRRRVLWIGLGSFVLVTLAVLAAARVSNEVKGGFSLHSYFAASASCGAAIVIAGVGFAFVRNSGIRGALVALLVVAEAIVLFAIPEASAVRHVRVDRAPVDFLRNHVGNSRFFTLGPLQPNYGSYFGIGSLNVNDIPIPEAFSRYVHARLDTVVQPHVFVGNYGGGRPVSAPSPETELQRNLAGYRAAAVDYVLVPAGQALPETPATFELVFRSPSTWIYHLAGAASYFTTTNPGCTVRAKGRQSVTLSCPSRTVLVRRETDLPGWSVQVDGHPGRLHRFDDLFQAVDIEQGAHQLTFSYSAPSHSLGIRGLRCGMPVAHRCAYQRTKAAYSGDLLIQERFRVVAARLMCPVRLLTKSRPFRARSRALLRRRCGTASRKRRRLSNSTASVASVRASALSIRRRASAGNPYFAEKYRIATR